MRSTLPASTNDPVRNPLEIIRGLLRLGTLGALAGGGLLAGLAAVVELIADRTITREVIGTVFLAGAGLGFAVTTAYGALLAMTSRARRAEDLSFWHAAAVSGILGALLPPALVVVGADSALLGGAAIAISGLLGALLGGGLVAVAKGSGDRRIGSANTEPRGILSATDDAKRPDVDREEIP
jgi:hypothetical protein